MLLYQSPTSPYSRKVRVVLLEKGVTYEDINVAVSERQPAEHNPLGKVPTFVLDDGTVLFDSVVITEALDALFPSPRLIPAAPVERALVRRWEALADGICDVVIPVVIESRRPEANRDEKYAAKLLSKARACLATLERHLSGRRHVFGDAFSLADIAIISMAGYLNLRCPDLLDGLTELRRYEALQLERASLNATIPPNLPIRS